MQLLERPTGQSELTQVYMAPRDETLNTAFREVVPLIVRLIDRTAHEKAWGIRHCYQRGGSGRVSIDEKTMFQVHINIHKLEVDIQILCKSGRDSIIDREGTIHIARQPETQYNNCKVKDRSILEAELL